EQAVLWRAALVAVASGLVFLALSPWIRQLGISAMGAAPEVSAAIDLYVFIRLWSAPFALLNYALLGFLLGRGQAGQALALQILLNSVNIILSITLGLGLGWGLAGVAWGTVIGEITASAVGIWLVWRSFRGYPVLPRARLTDWPALKRLMALNGDILIRSFVLMAAFFLFTRQGGQLGTTILAANAVLLHVLMTASYLLDGYAAAGEQLGGQSLGARDRAAFARTVRLTAIWGFVTALGFSAIAWVFGPALITLITTAPEVQASAQAYLGWAAAAPVLAVLAYQMDGIYIGATWSKTLRNQMLLSFALYLPLVLLLPLLLGNHGIWIALLMFLAARGATLSARLPRQMDRAFSKT
ncbi:MAG: MATE family efflux transporter, partial [Rhodospirillaceae bacterium]